MHLACDDTLAAAIAARLQGFAVQPLVVDGARRAAVALAVLEEGAGAQIDGLPRPAGWSTQAALLLTRRAAAMRAHAGQWALPGGRIDDGESPEAAALRELSEETGLHLGPQAVLGRLDDYATRSGYVITPVVVWAGRANALQPNPAEVHSIHRIALAEFLRSDAPLLDTVPGSDRPVLRMPVGTRWIAAPTAALIYQFRELGLMGRPTRVAHFDQPAFAWR